jgi:hypothetical protein
MSELLAEEFKETGPLHLMSRSFGICKYRNVARSISGYEAPLSAAEWQIILQFFCNRK